MFSFAKLAFAQRLLRARAASMEKRALFPQLLSGAARVAGAAGKLGWKAVKNPIGALGAGMGIMAGVGEVKGGMQKTRANQAGFDPKVQQYQSQPIGGIPSMP